MIGCNYLVLNFITKFLYENQEIRLNLRCEIKSTLVKCRYANSYNYLDRTLAHSYVNNVNIPSIGHYPTNCRADTWKRPNLSCPFNINI